MKFVFQKFFILISSVLLLAGLFVSCSYEPDFDCEEYIETVEGVSINKSGSAYVVTPSSSEESGVLAASTYPTMIFYPGAYVSYESYLPLMVECAKNGVQCILVEMPSNLAFFDINAAKKFVESKKFADVEDWYIAGHSLGGAMAAYYASKHPEYFKGLILLAAYSTENLKESGLKVLSIYGSNDGVLNMKKYADCLENLPEDYVKHVIEGGNHANFGEYGEQNGDNEADESMPADEQKRETAECIGNFCNS